MKSNSIDFYLRFRRRIFVRQLNNALRAVANCDAFYMQMCLRRIICEQKRARVCVRESRISATPSAAA
jgi:hypothetical protein